MARRREAPRREFFWLGAVAAAPNFKPTLKQWPTLSSSFSRCAPRRAKVIWPTRRETLITTGLVLMLVVFTSLFFLVVDEVLRTIVSLALGFGRGG